MFSLVSGFWKWLTSKTELRFLIVGLDNAGKTTTLEQLKRIYPSKSPKVPLERITPTIGLNLCITDFDRSTSGIFWDLGGQLMLRDIWEKHYNECDGLIFILDSTDQDRFDEAKQTLDKILHHPILHQRDIPILLLINKQDDFENARSMKSIIKYLGLISLIDNPKESHEQQQKKDTPLIISFPSQTKCSLQLQPTNHSASSLSYVLAKESNGPTLICVSACSAINNINIQPAIDFLVHEAKRFAELRRKEDEQRRRP